MKNPWKTVSQRVVYESRFVTLREDQVIRPDGTAGSYNVLSRSRSNQVVPVSRDGAIYLVGQWRYPTGRYSWELPGGGKDKDGETAMDAAKRELREESGLVSEQWTDLGPLDLLNGHSDAVFDTFLAEDVVETGVEEMADDGVDALRKVPLREVLAMVRRREISNPPTIASIFLYCEQKGLFTPG